MEVDYELPDNFIRYLERKETCLQDSGNVPRDIDQFISSRKNQKPGQTGETGSAVALEADASVDYAQEVCDPPIAGAQQQQRGKEDERHRSY